MDLTSFVQAKSRIIKANLNWSRT